MQNSVAVVFLVVLSAHQGISAPIDEWQNRTTTTEKLNETLSTLNSTEQETTAVNVSEQLGSRQKRLNFVQPARWMDIGRRVKNWEIRFRPVEGGMQPYVVTPNEEEKFHGVYVGQTTAAPPQPLADGSAVAKPFPMDTEVVKVNGLRSLDSVPEDFLKSIINASSLLSADAFNRKIFKCVITLDAKITICGYVIEDNETDLPEVDH